MSDFEPFVKPPEDCCSKCMESCVNLTGCETCLVKLRHNSPRTEIVPSKVMISSLKDFLLTLNINDQVPVSTPTYSEETLASVILQNLAKFRFISDIMNYLEIFSFESEINLLIAEFIMSSFKDSLVEKTSCSEEVSDDDSETTSDEKNDSDSSEYFDSDSYES